MKKSLKCTPFGTTFLKNCVCFCGGAPPNPLVGRGFLPSAIAASRLRRLQFLELGGSIAGNQGYTLVGPPIPCPPQPRSSGDATGHNSNYWPTLAIILGLTSV